MGRIAFVFSGQGDQHPGMGKTIHETSPAAAAVYIACDNIRPGTSTQCFFGTEQELKETKNTQPCLFATELAIAAAMKEKGFVPAAVAGFSLGEVTAATAAGIFDTETGFDLVCKRGALMQKASEQQDTAMAAILRLNEEQLSEICSRYTDVYPVNFNCPGQITVSGRSDQMPDFFASVKAAGGRALPLKVTGGFHSPFMKQAAADFKNELLQAESSPAMIPLYSNLTAEIYTTEVTHLLSEQICHPVLWEKTIRNMIRDGVDTFIEIGPGRTLTNMIKKIDPSVNAKAAIDLLQEDAPC